MESYLWYCSCENCNAGTGDMKRNSEWRLNQTTVHENGPMSQHWLTNQATRTRGHNQNHHPVKSMVITRSPRSWPKTLHVTWGYRVSHLTPGVSRGCLPGDRSNYFPSISWIDLVENDEIFDLSSGSVEIEETNFGITLPKSALSFGNTRDWIVSDLEHVLLAEHESDHLSCMFIRSRVLCESNQVEHLLLVA